MKSFKKLTTIFLVALIILTQLTLIAFASSYPKIFSKDLNKYNRNITECAIAQQRSGDCAIASIATIEAYMTGKPLSSVYDATYKANNEKVGIVFANVGYSRIGKSDSNEIKPTSAESKQYLEAAYNSLKNGIPCVVGRKNFTTSGVHKAVIVGYEGDPNNLTESGFRVMEISHSNTGTIFDLTTWKNRSTGDTMIVCVYIRGVGVALKWYGDSSQDIKSSPPTVTTTEVKNITQTNAVVYGSVSKAASTYISAIGIYLGTSSSNLTKAASESPSSSSNAKTSFNIWYDLNQYGTTLKPGTTYYWQCFATYNGIEYKGVVKSFTTAGTPVQAPVVQPAVTANAAANITATGAQISGLISNPDNLEIISCKATIYTMDIKIVDTVTFNVFGDKSSAIPLSGTTSVLNPDTKYYFHITGQYVDPQNPGVNSTLLSNNVYFTTTKKTEVVPPKITLHPASKITMKSAEFSATVLNDGLVTIQNCYITIWEEETNKLIDTISSYAISDSNYIISLSGKTEALKQNTKYIYSLTVKAGGIEYQSDTKSFTTLADTAQKAVVGISIKTLPIKTSYKPGEKFDPTGLTLTVTYSDGSSEVISSGYTYAPEIPVKEASPPNSISTFSVTISYQGARCIVGIYEAGDTWTDWTSSSSAPIGTTATETRYRTSTKSFGNWSAWTTTIINASNTQEVETRTRQETTYKTVYNYYHYTYTHTDGRSMVTYSGSPSNAKAGTVKLATLQTNSPLTFYQTYDGYDGYGRDATTSTVWWKVDNGHRSAPGGSFETQVATGTRNVTEYRSRTISISWSDWIIGIPPVATADMGVEVQYRYKIGN